MRSVVIALLFLLLATGCSTLRTEIRNDIDWSTMKTVEMPNPAFDNWGLLPLAEQELKATGLTPLHYGTPEADLRARFQIEEVSDLTETGAVYNRVKGIQLQLFDSSGRIELARSSYELSSTQNLKQGVNFLFTGLRKNLGAAGTTVVQAKAADDINDATQQSRNDISASTTPLATDQAEEGLQIGHEQIDIQQRSESPWLPRFQGWDFSNRNDRLE